MYRRDDGAQGRNWLSGRGKLRISTAGTEQRDNRPVGIVDSGLGGLTGLRAFRALLPEENVIYFGDSGRVPYGEKSLKQLRVMARQNLDFLQSLGVKAILVACGTLSSNAGDLLDACSVPTVGVLRASVDWMSRLKGTEPLAVAATAASVASGAYQKELEGAVPGREIVAVACPEFVPLIESGHCDASDPLVQEAVARSLQKVKESRAEVLLLGCTHYGLIEQAIKDCLGPQVQLVSAAESGAAALASLLLKSGRTGGSGETRFYTSGDPAAFAEAASMFCGETVTTEMVRFVQPAPIPEEDD